ncbi:hypothetical protein K438DRAFT_1769892 [Mycena galopus ATCC 62051]|nr:hypothetical protein K438DRAFT_1769892 [Mycena galopus ATCC 62051]
MFRQRGPNVVRRLSADWEYIRHLQKVTGGVLRRDFPLMMGRVEESITMMGHILALRRQHDLIMPTDAARLGCSEEASYYLLTGFFFARLMEQRTGALDIVELLQLIISKLKRKLIPEKNSNSYWGAIDKKLANAPKKHQDLAKQSKWIKQHMLDPDWTFYKKLEWNDLATGPGVPTVPVAGPSRLSDASADE